MYHIKLDSFCEPSLPVGPPHRWRGEKQRQQWEASQRPRF